MKEINRRKFIKRSTGIAAGLTILNRKRSTAANDKVIIGIMGLGGRGTFLAERFAGRADVEIAYLCDVDKSCFSRAANAVEEVTGNIPRLVQDFRKMLDDPDVDAIVNATPDHWHGVGTVMSCQAGKDVYLEKPASHNIWEGRKMVEAARKYNRIVQVGSQSRSAPYFKDAVEYVRSGKLGHIHLVRVFNMVHLRPSPKGPTESIPDVLDYNMWCGPAPMIPYSPGRWWFNRWDYSCGAVAGNAIHQIDMARCLIKKLYPDTVIHTGGIQHFNDGREIPDTQLVSYEYGNLTLILEAALWTPYVTFSNRDIDEFPNWLFSSFKTEILGTNGIMYLARQGGGWEVYNKDREVIAFKHGRRPDNEHIENFISCVRSRKRPNADIEEGHLSTLLCHIANISYRLGNKKLKFDPKTESFSNSNEANKYLKRDYRRPWIIPDEV